MASLVEVCRIAEPEHVNRGSTHSRLPRRRGSWPPRGPLPASLPPLNQEPKSLKANAEVLDDISGTGRSPVSCFRGGQWGK
jgi:hypothetical protein